MSLETDLRELGAHLDHPDGDGLVAAVRAEIERTGLDDLGARRARRRWPVFLAVAAVLLVALLVPLAWFGLADPGPDRDDVTGPTATSKPSIRTTPTTPAVPAVETLDLATARAAVQIPIRVPAGIEVAPRVTVDRRAPGGLVALEYPTFTVVEVGAPAGVAAGEVAGLGPESQVHPVSVRGRPGLWITGTHREIAYVDRDGALRRGPTRTDGHVLMWVEDGVTYRVEGFEQQVTAMQVADSLQ